MNGSAADWAETTVGAEFDVQLGKMLDAAKNIGIPKPYIGNRAVQWGRIDLAVAGTVPLTPRDMQRFRLRRGDLLVCEGGEVGRAAIWQQDIECYYQKALHRLRSRRGYDPRILLALLELRARGEGFADYVTQTSIAHLPREKFVDLPIPAIPRAEQRAVARVLGDAEKLIGTLERQIDKKRSIRDGLTQELLTGRNRLPGFTDEWRQVRLRDAGSTYGGLVGKNRNDFATGSGLFVTFMEVMAGVRLLGRRLERVRVRQGERQNQVQRGDILFNGSSETPEEVALAAVIEFEPRPGTFLNSFCFGYRLHNGQQRVDPTYLAYWFRSHEGRKAVSVLAQGATRYNIAKTKLIELAPRLPPLHEQQGILGVLRDADDEIEAAERRLEAARAIKTGMMQELLTGRTQLPVEDVS